MKYYTYSMIESLSKAISICRSYGLNLEKEIQDLETKMQGKNRVADTSFQKQKCSPKGTNPNGGYSNKNIQWLIKLRIIIDKALESNNSKIRVGFLANEMAMSERNLSRRLKLLIGMSPVHFINKCKITYAKKLILDGVDIRILPELTGFKSQQQFTKLFKSELGINPRRILSLLRD